MNKANIINRIKQDGRTVNGWARLRGHIEQTVHSVLSGRTRPRAYSYKAITADLKADGYMTDEDEKA